LAVIGLFMKLKEIKFSFCLSITVLDY